MNSRFHVPRLAPMLVAITVTLAFLVYGEWRLREMKEERALLLAEVRSLGFTDWLARSSAEPMRTKSKERNIRDHIRRRGGDVISLILTIQKATYEGRANDLQTQKMKNSLDASLMELSPSQVVALLMSLREAEDINFEERMRLMGFALKMLAERHPDEFIQIAMRKDDLIPEKARWDALSLWAKKDREAAISWMMEHETSRPDLVNEDTKREVIFTVGGEDPSRAFQLINSFRTKRGWFTAGSITMQAETAEQRTATLHALRNHLASLESTEVRMETAKQAYGAFGHSMRMQGFDAATTWLANAGLNENELHLIMEDFDYNDASENLGKWIQWMPTNLPRELSDKRIESIMGRWTEYDYKAAGTWLAQAPDNAAKPAAVGAYALTVVPFDPDIAEKWALTLPPDPRRVELLNQIHQRWPQGREAEKSAFAERHGIR